VAMPIAGFVKKPVVRYVVGVTAVALAFFIREILSVAVGPDFPEYLVFYPTVMTVALLSGFWPALFTIATTAGTIVAFWFIPGHGHILSFRPSDFVSLSLFICVCVFLSTIADLYRRNRQKAAAYDKERAQRESQAAMRQQAELMKLSFDAIIVWRMGGGIESWNRGAEELYGYCEAEALGRDIHSLLRTYHEREWRDFEDMLREQSQWDGELRQVTKEGREVIVSSRQHIGRGLDGEERVLEINRDVTDQKRVQRGLRRARDQLEAKVEKRTLELRNANRILRLVSKCDQALVQVSDERELTSLICQIIQDEGGYPLVLVGFAQRGEGRTFRCIASAGDREGFLRDIQAQWGDAVISEGPIGEAIRSGAPLVRHAISELPPQVPWKEAALARGFKTMAAFPLFSMERKAFGALVIYSARLPDFDENQSNILKELADDLAFGITSQNARAERDAAQRALELKASQLQMLAGEIVRTEQRERKRIAQLIHDQLQQLLAATLYGLKSLRTAVTEEEHQESFRNLGEQLRECIDISRSLTSEISHPSFSEPDLAAALEWLAVWMKDKHGLSVELESPEAVTIESEETRVMLLQTARELLFNVAKHSGVKTAKVRLSRSADGRVLITVTDDGVGFDASKLMGYGAVSGGIGLFSARERLALAGGGMEISSSPGHGSSFTVWISVAKTAERAVKTAPPELRTPPREERGPGSPRHQRVRTEPQKERIRVLLVDDHTVVRKGIALQLGQQPDMEIVGEASDAAAGVEMIRERRPDVVIMDVNMPGMNGIEATRIVHAELPEVSIIGLSMFDEPKQAKAMRDAGASDYHSKSASIDGLIASIRTNARKPAAPSV
jgi:PAS domain S-box-containing protein